VLPEKESVGKLIGAEKIFIVETPLKLFSVIFLTGVVKELSGNTLPVVKLVWNTPFTGKANGAPFTKALTALELFNLNSK
jgi:hypothetical protein